MSAPGIDSEEQLRRVRRICLSLPETTEKLSHGEPTFFVRRKVFVMFANNHHNDGHIAIWLPVAPGSQAALVSAWPAVYFVPPYVGVKGWVGIELARIGEEELASAITDAWRMIAPPRLMR